VVCITSLTGDDSLETKAAEDSLAVRRAASADVDAVCARSVSDITHPPTDVLNSTHTQMIYYIIYLLNDLLVVRIYV